MLNTNMKLLGRENVHVQCMEIKLNLKPQCFGMGPSSGIKLSQEYNNS